MRTLQWVLTTLTWALLVAGCGSEESGIGGHSETRQVEILIDDQERVFVDGERVAVGYLGRKISRDLQDDRAIFVVTVAPTVSTGLVSDVQQQIPAKNMAGIRYPAPTE